MFFAVIGALLGYVFHRLVVNSGEECTLLGNPWVVIVYGALLGFSAAFHGI